MDYEVTVYGDSVHLNEHGFILDRNAIPEYFKRTYSNGIKVLPSCEIMAANAARDVSELCGGRAHKVEATVGGAMATWSKARKVGGARSGFITRGRGPENVAVIPGRSISSQNRRKKFHVETSRYETPR